MQPRERSFTCGRSGLTIRGMQYFPDNFQENKKYPSAIVSHGFTDNYKGTADYCRFFAGMVYAAFGFSQGGLVSGLTAVPEDGDGGQAVRIFAKLP